MSTMREDRLARIRAAVTEWVIDIAFDNYCYIPELVEHYLAAVVAYNQWELMYSYGRNHAGLDYMNFIEYYLEHDEWLFERT